MIGVYSFHNSFRVIEEFFELFKTPWEIYRPERIYDVVIAASGDIPAAIKTRALIVYSSPRRSVDRVNGEVKWVEWNGIKFPLYGDVTEVSFEGEVFLHQGDGAAGVVSFGEECATSYVGYDLFEEVWFLLTHGQPPEQALIPTLEIHISILRDCMLKAGVSFIEVPPAPPGYEFSVSLTHDVDFVGIRDHLFDRTMWGFLYRAVVVSTLSAIRGKLPWSRVIENWKAVFALPLVLLGLKEDFWLEFERFTKIESGLGSTFFFIPFRDCPGRTEDGSAPINRAAKYNLADVQTHVDYLVDQGCEVGLHGIDAWRNAERASIELKQILQASGRSEVGLRMHWLYFSQESPRILEEAGAVYDSTFGYNDAVGFRAGTAQVFCPLTVQTLLELPLIVQDTAMLYPSRMGLSEARALDLCRQVIDTAVKTGGTVTVNWHTRSLSPERLWGDFYGKFLAELRKHCVWFATAEDIVRWYRGRRSLRFEKVQISGPNVKLTLAGPPLDGDPGYRVRLHRPEGTAEVSFTCGEMRRGEEFEMVIPS